jgi:hypothetical protein
MVFSLRPATEAIIGHLEIGIIATKEKTAAGQVTRQGDAWTVFPLVGNCSRGIYVYPTGNNCKQDQI